MSIFPVSWVEVMAEGSVMANEKAQQGEFTIYNTLDAIIYMCIMIYLYMYIYIYLYIY